MPHQLIRQWVQSAIRLEAPRRCRTWALVIGLATFSVIASGRETLDFRTTTTLPDLGLRVRLPLSAVEDPLPPVQQVTYRVRQGSREWTEPRYDPRELWYRSQHAGQWRDAHGNLLILARVTHSLPSGFDEPHVSRREYELRFPAGGGDLAGADVARLLPWARDFLGASVGSPEPLRFLPFRIRSAAFVPTGNSHHMAYFFQVIVRQVGERSPHPRTFFAEMRLAPGADPSRARQSFEERFLQALDTVTLPAESRRGGRQGRRDEDLATVNDDESMRRGREDARRSIVNLSGWWHADTPNYIILSNQRRGASRLVDDIESDLERMREAYRALAPPLREIQTVSIIRIFATPEEYAHYVGPDYAWSGGVWDESRGELVIRPVQSDRYRDDREATMRTIYHEAFHQYLSQATTPRRACVWFNEGHATFFEHASIEGNRVAFNESEPLAQRVGAFSLEILFGMDYAEFYAASETRRHDHYAMAWSLIYYLRRAAASERNFRFANFLNDYLAALAAGDDGPRATRGLFSRYDIEALERDYLNFWNSPRRRRFAQRAPALPN